MMNKFKEKFAESKYLLFILFLGTGFIGIVDYYSGYEISFSIFYLIPISLITLNFGKTSGTISAIFSALIWFTAEFLWKIPTENIFILFWNTAVRFGIFLITVNLISTINSFNKKLENDLKIRTSDLVEKVEKLKISEEKNSKQLNQIKALRSIDIAIMSSFDLRVVLDVIQNNLSSLLNIDASIVLLFDQNSQTFDFASSHGLTVKAFQNTHLRLGEGFAGQAAIDRKPVHIPDLHVNSNGFIQARHLSQEKFVDYFAIPLISKGLIKGVLECFSRTPFLIDEDWMNIIESVAGQTGIAIENITLFNQIQQSGVLLEHAYDSTLEGWARALDLKDHGTEGHTRRVVSNTLILTRGMGVSDKEITDIRRGALLHDIGKMGIPDAILLKPGPLTDDEWEIMHRHPLVAVELLSPITYLKSALDIPRCHHEKWDGSGYPYHLKGEEIPIAARIFTVVDVWDALTSDRPYRNARDREKALIYIREQSDKHFDPEVVNVFLYLYEDGAIK